jgi:hypothetical protein
MTVSISRVCMNTAEFAAPWPAPQSGETSGRNEDCGKRLMPDDCSLEQEASKAPSTASFLRAISSFTLLPGLRQAIAVYLFPPGESNGNVEMSRDVDVAVLKRSFSIPLSLPQMN